MKESKDLNPGESNNTNRLQELSEKTGIEMVVINEAEKIAGIEADHFKRRLILSRYVSDPIQSTIHQESPRTKTVLLPGISFRVDRKLAAQLVNSLNTKFAYRDCIAFISDNQGEEETRVVTLIQSSDKYNTLRLQETSGGSYFFSTDTLITKLKAFEEKYPFRFLGVGDDWLIIKPLNRPKNWVDFAAEVDKVCPDEDNNASLEDMAHMYQKDEGEVFMWWD